MHSMALFSTTKEKMDYYIEYINYLSNNFPCAKCIVHFKNYLKTNNPTKYLNVKDGLFKWSVEFHNSVNARLGKPVITLVEAYKLYSPNSGCTVCGTSSNTQKSTTNVQTPKTNTNIPKSVANLIEKDNGVTFQN